MSDYDNPCSDATRWALARKGRPLWKLSKKQRREAEKLTRPVTTYGRHTELYAGPVPAWDESLGDFMCFEGCCQLPLVPAPVVPVAPDPPQVLQPEVAVDPAQAH